MGALCVKYDNKSCPGNLTTITISFTENTISHNSYVLVKRRLFNQACDFEFVCAITFSSEGAATNVYSRSGKKAYPRHWPFVRGFRRLPENEDPVMPSVDVLFVVSLENLLHK